MPQFTFERVEKKYLLTPQQLNTLQPALLEHMQPDEYGRHTICNLYYDTPDYRLIRTSLQKPLYKEKLRLRSYGTPRPGDPVFAELKKKYRGVVYKRRTELELTAAERWLSGDAPGPQQQIGREIDYFNALYHTRPMVFLAYRVAMFGKEDTSLRLTLDENIRWRTDALHLAAGDRGAPLSIQGMYLMEIKLPAAMPLWLVHALAQAKAAPVSFSKYGCCYKEFLQDQIREEQIHVG